MRNLNDNRLRRHLPRALGLLAVGALLATTAAVVTAQDKDGDTCSPTQRKDVDKLIQPTAAVVEDGRQAYQANCASCHGDEGRGDGPQGRRLSTRPPNLRQDVSSPSPGGLFASITGGHTSVEVPKVYSLDAKTRFAIAHFIRSDFLPTSTITGTSAGLNDACASLEPGEQVICKPSVKKDLDSKLNPTRDQLARGAELYKNNCSSCHGDKGVGDGPAAVAFNPPPRNFQKEKFKNGSSAFAIFNTLAKGLGANMPAFEQLPEEQRWAITHYIRGEFIPDENREDPTPAQVQELCIELSSPPRPDPIPIDAAMDLLVAERDQSRKAYYDELGAVRLNAASDDKLGQDVYASMCASCHGTTGQGVEGYERYGRFPYVSLSTLPLTNQAAAGNYRDFTSRVLGVHQTLPDMTAANTLTEKDFQSLQAFMGKNLKRVADLESDEPKMTPVALLSGSSDDELLFYSGKVYRLTHDDAGVPALHRVYGYADFRRYYEGPVVLPVAQPAEGLSLTAKMGADCLREPDDQGNRSFCTSNSLSGAREVNVNVKLAAPAPRRSKLELFKLEQLRRPPGSSSSASLIPPSRGVSELR